MHSVIDVVTFEVERGKVGEFARATFADDPIYTDRQAAAKRGHADLVATPSYVAVSLHHRDQRAWVETLGLDIERVVVGSVRWVYRRPLVVGDSIVGTRRVTQDLRKPSRGGEIRVLTLETEFVDQSDEIVATEESVVIERHRP